MSALLGNCAPVSRSSSSRESDIRLLSYFFQQVASRKRYWNPGYFCLWNSESGEIWHRGIWNPGLWNLEYSSRNPESYLRLKSSDKDWNPVPGIQNPRRGIQNPRLSWIALHEAKHGLHSSRKVHYYWTNHHLTIIYQSKVWTNLYFRVFLIFRYHPSYPRFNRIHYRRTDLRRSSATQQTGIIIL